MQRLVISIQKTSCYHSHRQNLFFSLLFEKEESNAGQSHSTQIKSTMVFRRHCQRVPQPLNCTGRIWHSRCMLRILQVLYRLSSSGRTRPVCVNFMHKTNGDRSPIFEKRICPSKLNHLKTPKWSPNAFCKMFWRQCQAEQFFVDSNMNGTMFKARNSVFIELSVFPLFWNRCFCR